MPVSIAAPAGTFAVTIESDQYAPYVLAGETLVVTPDVAPHGRKLIMQMGEEFFIAQYDALGKRYSDIFGKDFTPSEDTKHIGVITEIFGARRTG